MEARLCFEF